MWQIIVQTNLSELYCRLLLQGPFRLTHWCFECQNICWVLFYAEWMYTKSFFHVHCPWTILWLITVQVTEFDPCFASSLHHGLWVHQNSQLYFTVVDITFDFVLKLVLALFSGRAEILPKNNLYRALTKIYGANKHKKVDSK